MTIVVEGIDGAGKTTYAAKLKKERKLKSIRFPNDKKVRQKLFESHKDFRTLIHLLVTDMVAKNIDGYVIDRWLYSTIVYQSEDFNMSIAETVVKIQSITGVDLFNQMFYGISEIHFLDTPYLVCKTRIEKRGVLNKYDMPSKNIFEARRQKYFQLFEQLIYTAEIPIHVIETPYLQEV